MAREPSYPEEAAVGEAAAGQQVGGAAADPREQGRKKQLVTGAAIGIGSAALVAALLYARRPKKHEKGNG